MSRSPSFYVRTIEGISILESYLHVVKDLERGIPRLSFAREYKDRRLTKRLEVQANGQTFLVKVFAPKRPLDQLKYLLFGSKVSRELRNSEKLLRQGLPIVPIVAAKDASGEQWVATEKLAGGRQLQDVLLDDGTEPRRRRALAFEYGTFARRLQDEGVWQYDFNPTNVLVKERELLLIDFERLRLKRRPLGRMTRLRMLARLNRIPKLSRTDRLRFLKGYLLHHPEEQAALKSLVAEVLDLTRRRTLHDDRKEERRCLEENRDFAAFSFDGVNGYYRKVRDPGTRLGLSLEQLKSLVQSRPDESSVYFVPHPDGVSGWQKANREARHGGPTPLAVIFRKKDRAASLVFSRQD